MTSLREAKETRHLATLAFVARQPARLYRFQRPSMKSMIEDVGPTFAPAIAKYFEEDYE
jgi:hypothetical protein